MKQSFLDNLKNLRGWRTPRKLLAFAVDDYANVRVASKHARERLINAGLALSRHMDRFDAMETKQDLEALFEILDSVRDVNGRPAVFTAYALSANPDFERIIKELDRYVPESVNRTFERLQSEQPAAYSGAWELWKEGMFRRLIRPQFHGREHLNVRLFEEKLNARSRDLIENLENRSLAGLSGEASLPGISFSQAFAVHDDQCLSSHQSILEDGMQLFEACYGFRSVTFTPPAQVVSPLLYPTCEKLGINLIHKPRLVRRLVQGCESKKEFNWTGKRNYMGHSTLVRNVVFEPSQYDARGDINRVMDQIRAAFRWSKPAVISSHRVNFCGHIDESNRTISLNRLAELLNLIIETWPEVEFVSVDEIAEMMIANNSV